ncbi:hypothetical protein NEAUS04_1620 [Nematocida ausubeli]|uniref:Lysosomal dipeptide transporter MFSD1 n=1 Tax=Nematocida ausubeli (strain ATCC PRA-371 / ERTm2) TaxID=1913371 RepID=A0A086J1X5_NEMA1|nr:uncharacterized protein NESG_01259 [Nematocida ausubeli]KAI5136725.1 hypothetical protein NEAUS07_1686 [Nematocida ausubeli]KAI5149394.1 hypothetical protein NEAUS05_1760 [Nematocida ausubeli]KAI5163509.1 hypothetical protein NEAUS04_1620 [Nematocida ausubeli]KFG26143.1 hypothetical protein NESG_01259 [Nematocida ausubeli]
MKIPRKVLSKRIQFFVLSSLALFFFFFAYDSPSPMFTGLEATFGPGYARYHSLLYSAYALPNLLLPLLFNLSAESDHNKLFYTYGLIVLGQTITSIGACLQIFECILAGRFIIGLGGESFTIIQNKMLSSLFYSHEHGRIFGLSLAIGRLGSILAYLLLGTLIEKGLIYCSLLTTCLIWLGGALIMCICRKEYISTSQEPEIIEEQNTHHLLPFFIGMGVLLACSISIFSSNNSAILQRRLNLTSKQASRALALQEVVALGCTVVISIITDKYGHRLSCICLGSIFLIFGHSMIFYSISISYLPSFLLGLASGMQTCNWPCYPLLLSPDKLGIGLSLLSCSINLAYSVCPPIISRITDSAFKASEYYSILFATTSAAISGYIILANTWRGYGLNGTSHYKVVKTELDVITSSAATPVLIRVGA